MKDHCVHLQSVIEPGQKIVNFDEKLTISGITTNYFGNTGYNQDKKDNYEKNIILAHMFNADLFYKLFVKHGNLIKIINEETNSRYLEADGLIYFHRRGHFFSPKNPLLISNTADCPIIILTNATLSMVYERKFIALIHSGWRSTSMNIVGRAVKIIQQNGILPKNIYAFIWPGICGECFKLDHKGVPEFFDLYFPNRPKRDRLHLKPIIIQQLINARIPSQHITIYDYCSFHTTLNDRYLFHSYRREKNGLRNAVFATSA